MDEKYILPVISMLFTILGAVWGYFKFILDMQQRLTRLETKTELTWNAIGESVKIMLKHPHETEKDDLLDKLTGSSNSMNLNDLTRLKTILSSEMISVAVEKNPIVLFYSLALARIDTLLFEKSRVESKK